VPKRGGLWYGQTVNFAHHAGWAAALGLLTPLLLLAAFACWATR
jgi:hypothetical protein